MVAVSGLELVMDSGNIVGDLFLVPVLLGFLLIY